MAVDPDPHGSAFIFPPKSGSAFNTYADPDPGGENLRKNTKMQGNWYLHYKILSKYGQAPLFLSIEQSFLSISTLRQVICFKFC